MPISVLSCSVLYRSIPYFDFALSDYFRGLRPVPLMAQLVAPTLESVGERAVCGASPGFRYNILRPATTAHSVGSETSSRVQDIGTQGGDTSQEDTATQIKRTYIGLGDNKRPENQK